MAMKCLHQSWLKSCLSVQCVQFSSIIFSITPKHRFSTKVSLENPLLTIDKYPEYKAISPDLVKLAIPLLINETRLNFTNFENDLMKKSNYSWTDVITKFELISDKLELAWNAVSHLHGVRNNHDLRSVYQEVLPEVVGLQNTLSQSKPLYEALRYLDQKKNLDECQRRIITSWLRAAEHSGVHFEGKKKEEFSRIIQEIAELGTSFMNNVLDSTKTFSLLLNDHKDVDGLPTALLSLLASSAAAELNTTIDPKVGPWKLSLDQPCFEPFMKHSLNDQLREKLYKAYISRASVEDSSNIEIIEKIRELRKRKAVLLGFENYAQLSLSNKMAKYPLDVWKMLNDLKEMAKPVAMKEMKTLQEFALKNGYEGDLQHWDVAFWSERQREHLFNWDEEKIREYFPLPRVLSGLFSLAEELFQIHIREVDDADIQTWHEDVRIFNIFTKNGQWISSFFLDPYSRPEEKQGGAWMLQALGRNDELGRKPVAYLICNQSPPIGETPSLMTFREVLTLFHEFGHGLQHMLTDVIYPSAAGINNVEWDAVELPSQFMENWLYDWSTIQQISSHYQSGEVLPKHLFQQMYKGKNYHAGLTMLRQLYFSALDIQLYTSDDPWQEVMARISDEFTVLKPLKEDFFPCSFLHIFSYGYAAGYYSYKWAEVLSADAFSVFEEAGLENRDKLVALGKRFRETVLSKGGSRHPEDVFIDFRGRKPSVNALLKSHGLK